MTRQTEHILINVSMLKKQKMLENDINCDNAVNRGRSVLKTSLWHIKHVLNKTQRKIHSEVQYFITNR